MSTKENAKAACEIGYRNKEKKEEAGGKETTRRKGRGKEDGDVNIKKWEGNVKSKSVHPHTFLFSLFPLLQTP